MKKRPLILVSPDFESQGREHRDPSISLSGRYLEALMGVGGMPLTMPVTVSRNVVAECVAACDGVMLTGGDDIEPRLYADRIPLQVRRTVEVTSDGGHRDYRELLVIDEVFRQRKPLLAICRGHQLLNIGLGGTLFADLPSQRPGPIRHGQSDKRNEIVHEVRLTAGSGLAKITGSVKLGVNSTHHQAVARIAPPLQATAASSDGVVEGLELKPDATQWLPWLMSVQFHPERLADRYEAHRAIFRAFTRVCGLNGRNRL